MIERGLALSACLLALGCAPAGYHYETGSFTPTPDSAPAPPHRASIPANPTPPVSIPAPPSRTRTPVETGAVLYDYSPDSLRLVEDLARTVRAADFRCDTVSSARPMILAQGYVLTCNGYRYTYDIQDKGGHWTVSVE